MFDDRKTKDIHISIIALVIVFLVIGVGAVKMLADQNVNLVVTISDGSGSAPPVYVPPVTPVIPEEPTQPTVPTTPGEDDDAGTVEEIENKIKLPFSPQTPSVPSPTPTPTPKPTFTEETITDIGNLASKYSGNIWYKLFLAFLFLLILVDGFLFTILFLLKKNVIYNTKTREPVAGVEVILYDKKKKKLQAVTTDEKGKFRFDLDKIKSRSKEFIISVKARGYTFPSKNLKGKRRDGFYGSLYFGEKIMAGNKNKLNKLGINIPLDPKRRKA